MISGTKEGINKAIQECKSSGAKKAIPITHECASSLHVNEGSR